ncbi:hypothetical protein BC834DRAFT_871659 [Gloeopeniophorella convolvens]|nr:hypothetical protein BC834DRAFT_917766 [Gloeopeniophorella convolvens]KAI0266936.1 hypothetical protein BC834DRAFT_871659 [Gloeopeniophorella convolvens]
MPGHNHTGRDVRGRGGRGHDRGGRGGRGGRGRGGRGRGPSRARGRGLGYVGYEGDDLFVDSVPTHIRNGRGGPKPPGPLSHSNLNQDSGRSTPVRGTSSPRRNDPRRGRGRGGGFYSPDLMGPKDRARQRHLASKLRHSAASLSQLLYEDRPLLKPIVFVRSKHTPSLFMEEEEIFQAVVEEAGERDGSHIPTAERVYRVFHSDDDGLNKYASPSDTGELLEVDFADLGKVIHEVEALAAKNASGSKALDSTTQPMMASVEERFSGFYVDTKPALVDDALLAQHVPGHAGNHALGEDLDDDEDVIVYVAPHPRNGKLNATPVKPSPSEIVATTTDSRLHVPSAPASPQEASVISDTVVSPVHTSQGDSGPSSNIVAPGLKDVSSIIAGSPRSSPRIPRPRRIAQRQRERHAMFGSFGAIREESELHKLDPRKDEQRRGDSDVDWGDSTSDEDPEDGGMIVDRDIDVGAMQAFASSMSVVGQAHVSAGDLEDEARVRAEDEEEGWESDEGKGSGSDSSVDEQDAEVEMVIDAQEGILMAEGSNTSQGSSSDEGGDASSSEAETPKRYFQARLRELRERAGGRPIEAVLQDELERQSTAFDSASDIGDEDEVIARMQGFLDANDGILRAHDRKGKNRGFQAVQNGQFEVDFPSRPAKRGKDKDIPQELQEVWNRDRMKKAERKRLRRLEQFAAAADPFSPKKHGKKARKARLAAASVSPISLEDVVDRIKQFVADIGGGNTLALPPMDRHVRKEVHEIAHAFNLKSKSKGGGAARYTTLIKTTRSGVKIDQRKVARLLRQSGSALTVQGRAGATFGTRKPRDGEVVGKTAPKIDGSNIGFRMLSAMGWEEGDRIGVAGGLDAPLTAIIKTTKLGLGANRL